MIGRPNLHLDFERKEKYESIEKINFNQRAFEFVEYFVIATKQFLADNKLTPCGDAFGIWIENLNKVFGLCLKLKASINLREDTYTSWCRAEDLFDPRTMEQEEHVEQVGSTEDARLMAPVFPGVVERQSYELDIESNATTICRAVVMLRSVHPQGYIAREDVCGQLP